MIFLTFKDVKFDTWAETFAAIRDIFAKETRRHKVVTSDKCHKYSKKAYEKLASALFDLTAMLYRHYDSAPLIIIDENDTPSSRVTRRITTTRPCTMSSKFTFGPAIQVQTLKKITPVIRLYRTSRLWQDAAQYQIALC